MTRPNPATKQAQQPAAPQSDQDQARRQDASDQQATEKNEQLADDRAAEQQRKDVADAAKGEDKRQKEAQKASDEGRTAEAGAHFEEGSKLGVEVLATFAFGRTVLAPFQKLEVPDGIEARNGIAAGLLRLLEDDEKLDNDEPRVVNQANLDAEADARREADED